MTLEKEGSSLVFRVEIGLPGEGCDDGFPGEAVLRRLVPLRVRAVIAELLVFTRWDRAQSRLWSRSPWSSSSTSATHSQAASQSA